MVSSLWREEPRTDQELRPPIHAAKMEVVGGR